MPVTELDGRTLTAGDDLGLPGAIRVLGKHLIVLDRLADFSVQVIDRKTGAVVGSAGREGEGPGEFRAPMSLDVTRASDAFWIFDTRLQRLTKFRVTRSGVIELPQEIPIIHLRADAPVVQPVWVGSDRLLAHGFFFGGRLAEFNGSGRLVRFTAPLPPNPEQVPANVLQHAYQATLGLRPDRSLLVLANRHGGTLEIYDAEGNLLQRVTGPYAFEPRFSVRQADHGLVMTSGEDLRFGYIDVAVSQDRVYALFSGRTRRGFPGRANYAEYVHVFNWEGSFLGALKLDTDAFTVAVDEEAGTLYAVRHLPGPAVLRYELKEPSSEG